MPVSIRNLFGAGGRGKTRLALEVAREISQEGWLAGFATADNFDRFRRQNGVGDWRWDKLVLVILDYAASRADQLRARVRELLVRRSPKVAVAAARTAGQSGDRLARDGFRFWR